MPKHWIEVEMNYGQEPTLECSFSFNDGDDLKLANVPKPLNSRDNKISTCPFIDDLNAGFL
jgi:hypothetical protein